MKKFLIIAFVLMSCQLTAQTGVYILDYTKNQDGTKVKWELTLDANGTFTYHFFRDISSISKNNKEENFYGKGTWTSVNNLVFFKTNQTTDLDEKYTVNFSNSKAIINRKSRLNTSDKPINSSIRFYESDLFYIKGLELFKQ